MAKGKTGKKKTKKEPAKKKMGRPPIEIDKKMFESLCSIQCSKKEICQVMNVKKRTLERWCKKTYDQTFVAVFDEKRVAGVVSLRRSGFTLAKTNAAVWIFMAKNLLGMKDKPEEDQDAVEPTPVIVNINVQDCSKPKDKADEA